MKEQGTYMKKNAKPKRKNRALFWLLTLVVIIVLTTVCSIFSFNYVTNIVKNKDKEVVEVVQPENGTTVDIPLGSNTDSIAKILQKNAIIKYPLLFKIISKINGFDGRYKAGAHIVSKDFTYDELMQVLSSNPVSTKVTLPEGLTYKQAVDMLINAKLIDKSKFDNIAKNEKFSYKFLEGVPERENKLEGYLFPDTYEFGTKADEKEIIKRMLDNFNDKFKPEYYQRAKELKMTVDQIVILASIVEREAKLEDERKTIAGVFYNRLKSKDKSLRKLQSCATIQYIFLNKEGKVKEKITDKDTKIQDPYNTYEIDGLPPGPICSPGLDSIEAALYPEKTSYMYFVAKGDGTHQFSKTLKEQQAAMKKYGLTP